MAPTGLLHRLKSYVTGELPEPQLPAISTTQAIGLLIIYTLIYVVPFYLSSTTRPSSQLSRDAPSVIRGRIRSVTASCIICSLSTFLVLSNSGKSGKSGHGASTSVFEPLHSMGYYPVGLMETVKSLGLTALLFLGPLFENGIVDGGWRDWIRLRGLDVTVSGWIGYRNFVAGPITEEVLFRSCAVPLLILSRTSNSTIIFLTPIIFGLAHVHHFYEFRITHPHTPVLGAVLRSVFQLSYTTLFGGYATFVYMRTGSLLSVILLHAFCNWMGLPRLWGRLTTEETSIGPDVGQSKRREDTTPTASTSELSVAWTVAYYVLLVAGALGWYRLLWPLTESASALVKFDGK